MDMKVFHPNLSQATLVWPGDAEDYFVEIASDSRFQPPAIAGLVHRAAIKIPIPAHGPLYWRISDSQRKQLKHQGSAVFREERVRHDLAVLRHEVPDGVEQTTIYYQDRPPALTFTFGTYADATAYRLAIYGREHLEVPLIERVVSGHLVSLRAGALGDGAYVWSATPLGKNGEPLVGGRMNRLEIAYDNSVPSLAVRSPKNGEVAKAAGVIASGVAPVGSRVFIDGVSIALDRFNRFSQRITPIGHPPIVVFQLTTPSQPALFIARALTEPK
jgi:hypothetical protein